jgi:hypothetical protein
MIAEIAIACFWALRIVSDKVGALVGKVVNGAEEKGMTL